MCVESLTQMVVTPGRSGKVIPSGDLFAVRAKQVR
jgi:hypothetical protein